MKLIFNKLVRDKIPQYLESIGKKPVVRVSSDEEYWSKLKEKLLEEANEFLADDNIEELADIAEVLDAILAYKKISRQELKKEQEAKAEARGRFEKRLILDEVFEPEGSELNKYPPPPNQSIRIGIGVMILKGGQVLLGKRKNAHGSGDYAFPGGHLEYMENFEECALREVAEECGIKIKNLRFQVASNIKLYAPKHYVHIGMTADWESGEPKVLEPDKCESWKWHSLEKLPEPIFLPSRIGIESYANNFYYYQEKND